MAYSYHQMTKNIHLPTQGIIPGARLHMAMGFLPGPSKSHNTENRPLISDL